MKERAYKTYCIYCKRQVYSKKKTLKSQWHRKCSQEIEEYAGKFKIGEIEIEQEIINFESSPSNSIFYFDAINLKRLLLRFYDIDLIKKFLDSSSLRTQCHIFHILVLKREPLIYNILLKKLEEHEGVNMSYFYLFSCFPSNILATRYLFELTRPLLTPDQINYIIENYLHGAEKAIILSENNNNFKKNIIRRLYGDLD